jgi:hypothetical protein
LHEQIVVRDFVPFDLETRDGIVLVDATATTIVDLVRAPVIPRSIERERLFLTTHAAPGGLSTAAFEEVCVMPGDRVAVKGIAVIEAVPGAEERGYRDIAQRARIVGRPDHPLTIGPP